MGRRATPSTTPTTLRYGYTSLVTPVVVVRLRRRHPRGHARASASRCIGYDPRRTRPSGCGRPPPTAPGCRSRSSTAATSAATDGSPLLLYGYGVVRDLDRPELLVGAAQPARPRRGVRDRARPRWRRARPTVVRRRQADAQAQHVHRLRRLRRAPRRERLHEPRPARGARRERRRPAHGRGREPAPRPLPCDRRRGAVRRLPHHDARRDAAAHDHRVGGVGRPVNDPDALRAA